MPLLREQRLLLCGLFIVGLNPLVITKSGRSLRFCRSRRLYTYFVNLMLTPLIVVNMIDELYEIFGADGRPQTRVVVQVCQGILLMIAYFVVLIYGLWSPRRKLAWINMLLRNCCTVEVISIRAIFQRTHYEAIGLNVLHLTLVVVLECMLREDLLPALMLFLIVLTVNMEVLHLRSMAEVLACRMSRVRQCFAVAIRQQRNQNVYGVMDHLDRFERLWILKNHLEQICGAFLGVHFVLDLIMVTFLLFIIGYFCSHVGGKRVFIICTVAFFTRIVPVGVKMVLLVRPFVRVAIEVDEIRAIAVKASTHPDKHIRSSLEMLLLKLQHMEKTKYISANDFFPINYTMLFNMAAAIVTHMLVLLQFQQWEDNQNMLFDEDSSNGTTLPPM